MFAIGSGSLASGPDAFAELITRLARRRSEARRWGQKLVPGGPDWLVLDLHYLDPAREAEILDQLGLTLDQARALLP